MIRFAILAGVSTDAQAQKDKRSIPEQINFCREKIAAHLGVESCGPFVMDGYSRTGYDSLDVAMQEIPPLAEAIHLAQSDGYDILIMDNFDRLGDLGLIVKTRFKKLRKQLYSARQSGRLIPPQEYDPYASEDADISMYVEGIIQTYRINKLRRGWSVGVPARARSGLHPLSIPFGYAKTGGKTEPARLVPQEAALIIRIKDDFLAGLTLQEICNRADASGIRPRRAPRWTITGVKRILQNKFYAGQTTFGKFKTVDGKRIPTPPSQWIASPGRHEPLYDEAAYYAILAEINRRDGLRSRAKVYALSGLLSCSICNTRLHRHGKLDSPYPVVLTCRMYPAHVTLQYDLALKLVSQELIASLEEYISQPQTDRLSALDRQVKDCEDQRRQIQQGYEARLYTLEEAGARIVSIETTRERLLAQREHAARDLIQHESLLAFARQDISHIQRWILNDDPSTVNRLLTSLCQTIRITPAYDLQVIWR